MHQPPVVHHGSTLCHSSLKLCKFWYNFKELLFVIHVKIVMRTTGTCGQESGHILLPLPLFCRIQIVFWQIENISFSSYLASFYAYLNDIYTINTAIICTPPHQCKNNSIMNSYKIVTYACWITGTCHYPGKYTINVCLYIDSIFTWIVTSPCGWISSTSKNILIASKCSLLV